MMASPDEIPTEDGLFQEARHQFLDSISTEERAHFPSCTSASDLIKHFSAPDAFKKNHKRWTKTLTRFRNFGEKLEPYFEVMKIVLQSHPQWTAIAFGAFRLVLVVKCDVTSNSYPSI